MWLWLCGSLVLGAATATGPCSRLLEHVSLPHSLLPTDTARKALNLSWEGWSWEGWSTGVLEEDGGGSGAVSAALLGAGGELKVRYRGSLPPPPRLQAYRAAMLQSPWTNPLWDCTLGSWLVGFVSQLPTDPRSRVGLYWRVEELGLDQCDETLSPLLPAPPLCDKATTKCVSVSEGWRCACLPGLRPRLPGPALANLSDWDYPDLYFHSCEAQCGGQGCGSPGVVMRVAFTAIQIFCILLTIAIGLIIFKRRKCKPVAHGMWTILEMLLLGILLLYSSVIPQLLEPSEGRCILERWIRELGFIICYGAIILKLYRILVELRSRKAHRFVVRDKELLKYLMCMVAVTAGYLAAWTATIINFSSEGFSLVGLDRTIGGETYPVCKYLWWDSVTQLGEVLVLCVGLHLGLAARSASVQFTELRYLLWAVCVEAVVSLCYHAAASASLKPSSLLVAAFLRSQLTNTVVLLLIFIPIILLNHKPVRDSRHHLTHESSDAYKPDGVPSDIEVAEVNISDMNPEEIRAELKRLYTQLEILKNKTIRQNNPHISKRRGGRKVAHRRFSLQKKGSREKALQQKGTKSGSSKNSCSVEVTDLGEQEVSRTPEDSVCSLEGPSVVDGPSTYSELATFTPSHHQSRQ